MRNPWIAGGGAKPMIDTVHIDVTELVAMPLRTGIQRVERELIRHWPGPARLVPIRFDPGSGFVELDAGVLGCLTTDVPGAPPDLGAERRRLAPFLRARAPAALEDPATRLLIPELFFDPARCAAYVELARHAGDRLRLLLYDFLVYLSPQHFPSGAARVCMPFLDCVRAVPAVAFISDRTRRDYRDRVVRRREADGPVFALGGDGFGLERQAFSARRKAFAVIGTIEPRKRVADVIEAFGLLWDQGRDCELHVVGRLLSPPGSREAAMLARFAGEPRFRHWGHATDDRLRSILRSARATLFVSEAEGFGIPPYESLSAGIPVICADAGIPSLDLIAKTGQIRLADTRPAAIASAVDRMLDDRQAAGLWAEAASVEIPPWKDFAERVAAWVAT